MVKRAAAAVKAVRATRSQTAAHALQGGNYRFPPVSGQVTMKTHFGKEMYRLASLPDTRLVLELGTWNGGGSSLCIGKGLKDSGSGFLFTMEAVEDKWLQAGNTLRDLPVKTILGSAVEAGDISPIQEILDGGGLPGINPKEWPKWWAGELELSESYMVPHLGELCKRMPFDLIVLDAAEFYGPAEYHETMAHCKSAKYVALHDAKMWKNRKPKARMLEDPAWKLISDDKLQYPTASYVCPALSLRSFISNIHACSAAAPDMRFIYRGPPDISDSSAGWAIFERV